MKVFYICAIFAVLAVPAVKADDKDGSTQFAEVCHQEAKSTPEEITKFLNGGLNPTDATDPLKCHFKCMMDKLGHLKEGILDEQAVIKSFENVPNLKDHKQELVKSVNECKGEKGANDCDTAFKLIMCFNAHKAGDIVLNEY